VVLMVVVAMLWQPPGSIAHQSGHACLLLELPNHQVYDRLYVL
jgi:hypothetical protein